MEVWLNGTFVPHDRATVSAFDAGLQHGVGLFETMQARGGRVFRIAAHLERLAQSARDLRLSEQLNTVPLGQAVMQTLQRNELVNARIRLTITGGNLNMLQHGSCSTVDPTILIAAQPPTQYPSEFFTQGITATIADGRENPLHPMAGHKTLAYWPRIRALQDAALKKAGEAIWFTVSNHLASGCVSNVFLVKDGSLLTPIARGEEAKGAIPSAILPGITRAAIFELAASLHIPVQRRMLDIEALLAADEVFLTNSSWGVLPVVGVERETISAGAVGELTTQLRSALNDLVDRETAADADLPSS